MLMAMLNCTLILVIILKHDCSQPTGSSMTPTQMFLDFWETRCEEDWQSSFKQFRMGACSPAWIALFPRCLPGARFPPPILTLCASRAGVPVFLVNLTLLGWVKFWDNPAAAGLITVVTLIVTTAWLLHTRIKWGRAKASSQPNEALQTRRPPPRPPMPQPAVLQRAAANAMAGSNDMMRSPDGTVDTSAYMHSRAGSPTPSPSSDSRFAEARGPSRV